METPVEAPPVVPPSDPDHRRDRSLCPPDRGRGLRTGDRAVRPDQAAPYCDAWPIRAAISCCGTDQLGATRSAGWSSGRGSTSRSGSWPCSSRSSSARSSAPWRATSGSWVDNDRCGWSTSWAAFPFYVPVIALVFVARCRREEHLHRDHRRRAGSPTRASSGRDPRRQAAGLRPRGAGRWPSSARIISGAPAAQRHHPGHRLRDVRHRAGHPGHRHPELPGPGDAPPTPDWGSMISRGTELPDHPLVALDVPGLAVVFVGLVASLLGDGLVDLLRGGERFLPLLRVEDLTVDIRNATAMPHACRQGPVASRSSRAGRWAWSASRLGQVASACARSSGCCRQRPRSPAANVWIHGGGGDPRLQEPPAGAARPRDLDDLPGADGALNPVMRIGEQIAEGPRTHLGLTPRAGRGARDRAAAQGGDPRPGAAPPQLSARVLRRHAPAGDDRDGPVL